MARASSSAPFSPVLGRRLASIGCTLLAAGCFRGFAASEGDGYDGYDGPPSGSPTSTGSGSSRLDAGTIGYGAIPCYFGQGLCSGTCVDLRDSGEHCGACDIACNASEQCIQGVCSARCPTGGDYCQVPCTSPYDKTTCYDCVPLATDDDHCGACGAACRADEHCVDGRCGCLAGLEACPDGCTDLAWDSANCGACDTPCDEGATCRRGVCTPPTSEWASLGHDMARGGDNALERGVPPLTLDWAVSLGAEPLHAASVSEGRAVTSTAGSSSVTGSDFVLAVDVTTGAELWRYELGRVDSLSPPTVVDGRVYVQHRSFSSALSPVSQLHALELTTGGTAWTAPVDTEAFALLAPTVSERAVYGSGGKYGGMVGLSRASGRELFHNVDFRYSYAWVAALHDGLVYSYVDNVLRAHDPRTGKVSTTIKPANASGGSAGPVFSPDGLVYLAGAGSLFAFEVQTRKLLWKAPITSTLLPALSGGWVLAYDQQRLVAFDAKTGELAWRALATDVLVTDPPVVAAGFAYVCSTANTYAVDLRDGSIAWQTATSGGLSIAEGRLFIATEAGLLYAYKLTPG